MTDRNAQFTRVRSLLVHGDLGVASSAVSELLRSYPKDPRAWQLDAETNLRAGRIEEGLASAELASRLATENTHFAVYYAQLLLRAGKKTAALEAAKRAAKRSCDDASLHDALGTVFTHCEEPLLALPHCERAVALQPTNVTFRFNLASAQRMVGDVTSAEGNLDRVVTLQPNDGQAHLARSQLRRQTSDSNHVSEMATIYDRLPLGGARIAMSYALAKELEDLTDYERAFAYLSRGARELRGSLRYDVSSDVEIMLALTRSEDAPSGSASDPGCENSEPIFVVGLPRSGTTLVDRIITSHPDVYGTGELNAFATEAVRVTLQQAHKTSLSKAEFSQQIRSVPGHRLGAAYIGATRPRTGHTRKFTDKTPINYLYAGLIKRCLPNARIVALRRHPVDACYAMYKMLFVGNYPFSYDLRELASYYVAWHKLMDHWEEHLGRSWLTVRYEELVFNQEATIRRILAHCDLPWDERSLFFYKQHRPVTSASAGQASRPIYADSVGMWRHYERSLQPLVSQLRESGIPLD